jgi:hypothetical protein
LHALGISGLFRALTPGTDWIATAPAGDEAVMQEIIAPIIAITSRPMSRAKLRVLPAT